jgi:lysophospholipase L1-like esterase
MTRLPYEAATICTGSFFEVNLDASGTQDEAAIDLNFQMENIGKPLPTVGVSFDGGTVVLYPMEETIRIPMRTLSKGNHLMRVTLVNLCEGLQHWKRPYNTGMMFRGMKLVGVSIGPKPAEPAKQILFVGDSITQGVRSRNADKNYNSSNGDDSTLTFSTLTAEALGYDLANVGFGRLGIDVIGNGGIPIAPYSVGYVCDGVPVDAGFQPDFIVIDLGTNDGNPDAITFDYNYQLMLSTLRKLHRKATIICLIPFGGYAKAQINKAVKAYVKAAGDSDIHLVDATKWIVVDKNWKPTEDTNDGIHPNMQGHKKAADQLISVIKGLIAK